MKVPEISVKKVSNGYILTDNIGAEHVYKDIADVFDFMLTAFEGLAPVFSGDLYGEVIVKRTKDK